MMGSESASAARVRKHRALQSNDDVTQSKKKKKDKESDKEQQSKDDDETRTHNDLDAVDINRLTTVFGNFSDYTKREYLKLKRTYDDDVLHSAIEKAWMMGGKTIGYVKKILEESRT